MPSNTKAPQPTRIRKWIVWPLFIICGLGTVFVTAWLLRHEPPASLPAVSREAHANNARYVPVQTFAAPAVQQSQGIDVLAELEAAHNAPYLTRSSALSNNINEAMQRALIYTTFAPLSERTDAEGLYEAAAWAMACNRHSMPDQAQRCSIPQLLDPAYADDLLYAAASAGQPGAVLEWTARHLTQWQVLPAAGGGMMRDRLFALASHGDTQALAITRQLCTSSNACSNGALTRNVLAILLVGIMQRASGSVPLQTDSILEGSPSDRRQAAERAEQLRRNLAL
jgi:hypothetical protein